MYSHLQTKAKTRPLKIPFQWPSCWKMLGNKPPNDSMVNYFFKTQIQNYRFVFEMHV